ncbi:MAG: aspartate/glutamate racemase family protein, partial [Desulfobulbia bacterium]
LEPVHQSYVDMATSGVVTDKQRQIFFECGREMCDQRGAEAVVLGGTDLFLAFEGQESGFNAIDCALWHIEELAKEAAL